MSRFHLLEVADVRQETRDAISIAFAVPQELKSAYQYREGQHLVLRSLIDGEEVRRSYSICSSPSDAELRIAVKRISGGLFSNYLNDQARKGLAIEAMPPAGHFHVELDPARAGRYLAVAAGSGITPIYSIVKTTLETEPNSEFTLFYGNRATTSTILREQLEDLKNRFMDRFNLIYIMTREQQDIDLYNGRIDGDKCKVLFEHWLDVPHLTAAFLCGPQTMIETVRGQLEAHRLERSRIHYELFAPTGGNQARPRRVPEKTGSVQMCDITVIADGRQVSFELARDTDNILDAGNAQGADLPYSCKAGVCSTCRARVVEGEVDMDANFALEDYEVEAGYVLSCQCYPVSDRVVLDFDH
ncbi:1,2-phenylacetyl-CoA epoxidase subunit PaaE [Marinobacterium aestuariivivens]|uniref:1,2-phenylacetyl-CoA epoxidase subunit PaaE n=1 Tax=Marinobacterium aestuariivivens TaxID=1698799 RepID=A0ABW1ZTS5_9GAMM